MLEQTISYQKDTSLTNETIWSDIQVEPVQEAVTG